MNKYEKIRKEREINFCRDLIKELKKFFKSKDEKEKLEIVGEISTWSLDHRDYSKIPEWMKKSAGIPLEDNSKCSEEILEITGTLSIMHHYNENPKKHMEYLNEILDKSERFLKLHPKTL